MAKASDNDFPSWLVTEQASKPTAPAAGKQRLYMKTDHKLYHEDSGGVETEVGSGASGALRVADGRLTLATGTPVTTADQTAKTTIYYTPYLGNQIGMADGTLLAFAETSVAVPATTSTPFDVFAYNNAGTLALETLNWTNDTTRATALAYSAGFLVKTGDTTRRYLGTGRTTGVSGQTEDSVANRLVWNYYNRVERPLYRTDGTSHSYTGAYRAWNNSTTHYVSYICGVAEDMIELSLLMNVYQSNATNAWECFANYDSFTVLATANNTYMASNSTSASVYYNSAAFRPLSLGYHYYGVVEASAVTGSTFTGYWLYGKIKG